VSDYLFDKQGEPDPEVERLEGLLGSLGYRGAPLRLPARRRRRPMWVAGGLSALAAALVALLIAGRWRAQRTGALAGWAATVRDGAATIDGRPLTGAGRLPVGAWLETASGRARLAVADVGSVEVAPGTRVRIVASGAARHELQLAHGTLAAVIDAPPRHFVVTTPRAVVTDLGCAFELTVDDAGRGRLAVSGGRVAVSDGAAREVVVGAGAGVELSEHGPGVPFAADVAAPPLPPQTPLAPPPTQLQTPQPARLQTPQPAQLQTPQPAQLQTPQPAQSRTTKPAQLQATKPARWQTARPAEAPAAPPRRTTRAPTAPPAAHEPDVARTPATSPQRTSPQHRPDPDAHVEHDSLKALEHSVE
jgi:ferric-dicitrate binding protein FerR (iron transport regulator)